MHVIIDFDHTVFNTTAFRQALFQALSHWVTEEQFYSTETQVQNTRGTYHLQTHIELLAREQKEDTEEMKHAAASVVQHAYVYLFPDAVPFLQRVRHTDTNTHSTVRITLLSFGDPSFQKEKIQASGIHQYVDTVYITDRPKELLVEKIMSYPPVIFITDRGTEIDAIKAAFPECIAVWLRRPGAKYYNELCTAAQYTYPDLLFDLHTIIH